MQTNKKLILAIMCAASLLVPGTRADAAFTRDLSLGKSGADVSDLQRVLMGSGYLKIASPTGYFGSLTRSALAAWQRANGIAPASGYFGPLSKSRVSAPAASPAAPTPQAPGTSAGVPARIRIPKLGIDAAIGQYGLTAAGDLDAPKNIYDAGWYKYGPRPGATGSAVLTGHVAQIKSGKVVKAGVFHDLGTLRSGDKIYVEDANGQTAVFVVRRSKVFDPSADAAEVFVGGGRSRLNIITCQGIWDAAKQSYTGRLVIFAEKIN